MTDQENTENTPVSLTADLAQHYIDRDAAQQELEAHRRLLASSKLQYLVANGPGIPGVHAQQVKTEVERLVRVVEFLVSICQSFEDGDDETYIALPSKLTVATIAP